MRGWIFVASAHGNPGRVRIGASAVDPRREAWRADGGELLYDALVDAPHAAVATVDERLRALRTADGRYRCTPEFAIAAIHHALGGPPAGERIYDAADTPARREPRAGVRPGERGGSTASISMPAVGAIAAVALIAWMTLRPPVPVEIPRRDAPGFADTSTGSRQASSPELTGIASPAATAATGPASTSRDTAASVQAPREVIAAEPPTVRDCATLESLLARCAARRGRECQAGTAPIAASDRVVMQDMQRAGRTFDAGALENFCRAACRHGYRPSHADFAATVCRAP